MRISDWSSDVCSSDLVKRDAIALLHPARFERIGKAADLAVELAVGQLAACLRGIVGLPDDRNIVAALRQMAIEAIGGEVQLAAFEPADVKILRVERSILDRVKGRSEEHTSELQSLMRISYAVFCLQKKHNTIINM